MPPPSIPHSWLVHVAGVTCRMSQSHRISIPSHCMSHITVACRMSHVLFAFVPMVLNWSLECIVLTSTLRCQFAWRFSVTGSTHRAALHGKHVHTELLYYVMRRARDVDKCLSMHWCVIGSKALLGVVACVGKVLFANHYSVSSTIEERGTIVAQLAFQSPWCWVLANTADLFHLGYGDYTVVHSIDRCASNHASNATTILLITMYTSCQFIVSHVTSSILALLACTHLVGNKMHMLWYMMRATTLNVSMLHVGSIKTWTHISIYHCVNLQAHSRCAISNEPIPLELHSNQIAPKVHSFANTFRCVTNCKIVSIVYAIVIWIKGTRFKF